MAQQAYNRNHIIIVSNESLGTFISSGGYRNGHPLLRWEEVWLWHRNRTFFWLKRDFGIFSIYEWRKCFASNQNALAEYFDLLYDGNNLVANETSDLCRTSSDSRQQPTTTQTSGSLSSSNLSILSVNRMGVTKEIIKEGDGKTFPKQGDQLTMHYTGTLTDGGKQFDSSVSRGRPFQFVIGIGQVIQGMLL